MLSLAQLLPSPPISYNRNTIAIASKPLVAHSYLAMTDDAVEAFNIYTLLNFGSVSNHTPILGFIHVPLDVLKLQTRL